MDVKLDRKYLIPAMVTGEIRKTELIEREFEIEGKKVVQKYIDITLDDVETDERFYLKDKNLDNMDMYKRGTIGTFKCKIEVDEGFKGKTKIHVCSFEKSE